jgi:glyoxylase-like metal-dependent hydrolase (beta-lactamase superfamily II)
VAGPIDSSPLRDDPVSAGARREIRVGELTLIAVSDGYFRTPRTFLGSPAHPTAGYDALAVEQGAEVRMPIGCFVVPGERTALIDLGLGPVDRTGRDVLVGGRLLDHLTSLGTRPADIDVITLSHLHADHIGWLADADGEPVFPNATVHLARADWDHFVAGGAHPAPEPHLLHALRELADRDRVVLLDDETDIVPGVRSLPAPGHTPGHSLHVVHDRGERVLLFGDAMYCPHQMSATDWAAASDVDPVLAARTLRRYVRDLEENGGAALGCHFPELVEARAFVGDR